MKKKTAVLVIVILVLTVMPMTAFGRGHGRSVTVNQRYTPCTIEDCDTVGTHMHNGIHYSGHNDHKTNHSNGGHH